LSSASSNLSDTYSKIISATGAFEGVLDMLRYQPLVQDYPDALDNVQLSGHIEFKNICFQYPGTNVQVLKNLTFTIESGEYVAFVGMRYHLSSIPR
jgi:subfamily B ATP-binding cassette protein MsbA